MMIKTQKRPDPSLPQLKLQNLTVRTLEGHSSGTARPMLNNMQGPSKSNAINHQAPGPPNQHIQVPRTTE